MTLPEKLIRTFGATLILVGVAVAGLVQMYGGAEPETAAEIVESVTPSTQARVTTTEDDVTVEEHEPFVYKVGLREQPSTFNFWRYYGSSPTVWDAYILGPTKASLFRINPATLELDPELARGMATPEEGPDGWHVDLDLKGGYQWSDGRPLSGHDLVFTFETVRSLGLGGQWADSFDPSIESIEALDGYNVRVRFSSQPSLKVWPYGLGTAPIMARHHWQGPVAGVESAKDLYAMDSVGDVAGGPLQVVRVEDDRIISASNKGYRLPAAEIVEYKLFETDEEQVAALANGDIHTFLSPRGLTPEQVASLEGVEGVSILTSPKFGVRYLGFNLNRAPMDEVAFRSAVALLVDRETLATEVAGAPVAKTLISDSIDAWYDTESATKIAARNSQPPAEAMASVVTMLKEAGYAWASEPAPSGESLTAGEGLTIDGRPPAPLTILTSGDSHDPARPEYAMAVAEAIELLGFEVIPVTTDFETVVDLAFKPDDEGIVHYDMVLLGWSLGNPALPNYHSELFASGGSGNKGGYASTKMDELVTAYDKATAASGAKALLWEMEGLIATDLPYLPLYQAQIVEAYRSDMVGYGDLPLVGGVQGALGAIQTVMSNG